MGLSNKLLKAADIEANTPITVGAGNANPEVIDRETALAQLEDIASDEWYRPLLDHMAAKWAIDKIEALESEIEHLKAWHDQQELLGL